MVSENTTIESLKKELEEFEKEDITKLMDKYNCHNCGCLSENLEIKKMDASEQIERFQKILDTKTMTGNSYGLYLDWKLRISDFESRISYVKCPICKVRKSFVIDKD